MFYQDSLRGDAAVVGFLLKGQWLFLSSFVGHLTSLMQLSYTLIAAIGLQHDLRRQAGLTFFIKTEVMLSALANRHTEDQSAGGNQQLDFVGMPLLFAGVIAPLFFLGRSTGDSPTSTRTILPKTAASILSRAFLPGRRKAPLFIRISSSLRTIRQPCDSL